MKTSSVRMIANLCLLAVGGVFLYHVITIQSAANRDFVEYWAAGQQLIHRANPYDPDAILRLERSAGYLRPDPQITYSPPVCFFLMLPLGLVGEKLGLTLWSLVLVVCLAVSVRMIWKLNGSRAGRAHLAGYCFAPVFLCLMAGQISIFFLFGVVCFLTFRNSRPLLAGAALLPCAMKPHLFTAFALALLLWAFSRGAYRVLAGFTAALAASCALALCFDPHLWSQYAHMMSGTGVLAGFVPTLSVMLRLIIGHYIHFNDVWLQFLPEAVACLWAVWYSWTRRDRWEWMREGMLVLLVSVACAPYAWVSDEAVLMPALLAGIYRAQDAGRSLLPLGIPMGLALTEVALHIQMTSPFYLWTPLAWIGWYLYAFRPKKTQALEAAQQVTGPAEPEG